MISGDFDSIQFVAVAALHFIGDDFFGALPIALWLRVLGDRRVLDAGVEVTVALQALTNVATAFFEKIDVDGGYGA